MASIGRDANGFKRVLFVAKDGSRKTVRLGKCSQRDAEAFKIKLEALHSAKLLGGTLDRETSLWLSTLGDDLHGKLVAVGLVEPRAKIMDGANDERLLGPFLRSYLAGRTDVKPWTISNFAQAQGHLNKYFGEDKPLADITPADAEDYRRSLLKTLSPNTARRHCGRARQFFTYAVKKRLLVVNPFSELKGITVSGNAARMQFISRDVAAQVLDACPDAQWRLIFALSRFGGLRCPSEHLGLKWSDVDWARNRMRVPSPKTEHHEGKAERIIPLFPELRPHLEAAFDEAPEGTEYVVSRYRNVGKAGTNLRTQFLRILNRAGLTPWPKLFHNLRASRETELAGEHPLHVVCQWIGNSQLIAAKHYLTVGESDFAKAAQIPAQQTAATPETDRNARRSQFSQNEKPPVLQGVSSVGATCEKLRNRPMPKTGIEPARYCYH